MDETHYEYRKSCVVQTVCITYTNESTGDGEGKDLST